MQPVQNRFRLSKRGAAALVYVAVALLIGGVSGQMSNGNLQWYSSARQLTVDVQLAELTNINTQNPSVIVHATVGNPSGLGTLKLIDIAYDVFANSTTQSFAPRGSSQIGNDVILNGRNVPASGTLNITNEIPVFGDIRLPLQDFVNTQGTNFRIVVGITLELNSSFGPLDIPYCYEMPGQSITLCPNARTQTQSGVAPGGGGR